MDSGFGDDEAYNVYDKPWRADKDSASNIYRPTRNKDKDTYGDDLDELIKTNRSDVFLTALCMNFIFYEYCAKVSFSFQRSHHNTHVYISFSIH